MGADRLSKIPKGQSEVGTQVGLPPQMPVLDLPGMEAADPTLGTAAPMSGLRCNRPGPGLLACVLQWPSGPVAQGWGRFKPPLKGALAPGRATGQRRFQTAPVSPLKKPGGVAGKLRKEAACPGPLPRPTPSSASGTPYTPLALGPLPLNRLLPAPACPPPPHSPRPPPPSPASRSAHLPCLRSSSGNQGHLASHRGFPRVAMGTAGLCDGPPRGRGGRRAHSVGIGPPRLGKIAGARSRSRPGSLRSQGRTLASTPLQVNGGYLPA